MREQKLEIPLDVTVSSRWEAWLQVTKARCHLHFELVGGRLDSHIAASLDNAMGTASRVSRSICSPPKKILEIGCSTGFNCIALSRLFPEAEVYGIEPDGEAVAVANSMAAAAEISNVHFLRGVGESLPYGNHVFDLIVCLTVIEHVNDVERVIAEMARVLTLNGAVRLEAPNYIWPYEPHLNIWCLPLLGKGSAKLMAVLQGKTRNMDYLDHLKFVTPGRLEILFRRYGLVWENQVKTKLEQVAAGDNSQIMAYKRVAAFLRFLALTGMSKMLVKLVMWSGVYPSVLYILRKAPHA